jgi:hypothetical protein
MSEEPPRFVVVGRTNEGKSSIVSTLLADDSVRIAQEPGTTMECREFEVKVDDEVVLVLIDSPGFENARKMLKWLKKHETSPQKRPDVLRRFVAEHEKDPAYRQEVRLLKPVLEGAGILYVVDGSHRFRNNYVAEIEILRWTSRERMALINDKDEGQYVDEWKSRLPQWFSLVRYFNAHSSGFESRVELLETLSQLYEKWRRPIGRAVKLIRERRRRVHGDAAARIARLLCAMLSHKEQFTLPEGVSTRERKPELEQRFHSALRGFEDAARRDLEALHAHRRLEVREQELERPIFEKDLFAESVWNVLGLSPSQLIVAGAGGGAIVGGGLDAALGGTTVGLAALVGGVVGAGSAVMMLRQRYAAASMVDMTRRWFSKDAARVMSIGPHLNKQFPWVVLDRALLHYRSVCNRSHSNRDPLDLSEQGGAGLVSGLSGAQRKELEGYFEELRSAGGLSDERRVALEAALDAVIEGFD